MPGVLRRGGVEVHHVSGAFFFCRAPRSHSQRPHPSPALAKNNRAPHAAKFVATPWFALQSRFDTWQLGNVAMLPCAGNVSKCTHAEWLDVVAYGPIFMEQFKPYQTPTSKNGAFLDACLIHGSTSTPIDGLQNYEAFQAWLAGSGKHGNWWTMLCGNSDTAGPCDTGRSCQHIPSPPPA